MKKIAVVIFVSLSAVISAYPQEQKEKSPDEQIIVNKKYDESGNLIEFDSTYVKQWSSDSAFHFGFKSDSILQQWNFRGIEHFFNDFLNDSAFGHRLDPKHPLSFGFSFSPFDDDEFRNRHRHFFNDSLFQFNFPYQLDSLFFNFGLKQDEKSLRKNEKKYFKDFEDYLNQYFSRFKEKDYGFPEFRNDEHQKEWEELMQKHEKELEELQKKWQKE